MLASVSPGRTTTWSAEPLPELAGAGDAAGAALAGAPARDALQPEPHPTRGPVRPAWPSPAARWTLPSAAPRRPAHDRSSYRADLAGTCIRGRTFRSPSSVQR